MIKKEKAETINKERLWKHVQGQLPNIQIFHVFAVVDILLDEISKDLHAEKKMRINNFGTFKIKRREPRRFFDSVRKIMSLTPPYKVIAFTLYFNVKNRLLKNLDLDATFGDP